MKGTLLRFPATGGLEVRQLDRPPGVDEFQALLDDACFEVVPFFDSIAYQGVIFNCFAFCDEDGKRKGLPINANADALWRTALKRNGKTGSVHADDRLVGPVLVVFGDRELMRAL